MNILQSIKHRPLRLVYNHMSIGTKQDVNGHVRQSDDATSLASAKSKLLELKNNASVNLVMQPSLLACSSYYKPFLRHQDRGLQASGQSANVFLTDQRYHFKTFEEHGDVEMSSSGNMQLDMALDLHHHLNEEQADLDHQYIIGHSLGAKASLLYTLLFHNPKIRGVFVLDAAPSEYTHSHGVLIKAMLDTPTELLESKGKTAEHLKQYVDDINTRAFAMNSYCEQKKAFRLDLAQLLEQESHVHSFPLAFSQRYVQTHYNLTPLEYSSTPTHFIGAEQSSRLTTPSYVQNIAQWYPNHSLHIYRGGHFVQNGPDATKIAEFIVQNILQEEK